MAKQTQANSVNTGDGNLPEKIATHIGELSEKYGKETVAKAVAFATDALKAVAGVDREILDLQKTIQAKAEGNTAFLYNLAKECVQLTMKGKRADLAGAAELMRASCAFAEDTFLSELAKSRNGVKPALSDVAKSWTVLKSKALGALGKAHLNPLKFANGTDYIQKAYDAWTKNPENAAKKSNRGRKEGSSKKETKAVEVPKNMADAAGKLVKLNESARAAITYLVSVVGSLPNTVQNVVANRIKALADEAKTITLPQADKEEAANKEAGVTTHRRPRANPVGEAAQGIA